MTDNAKEKLIDWLFSQGVSTVLLFAILAFLAHGVVVLVPTHIKQIEEGYGRNAEMMSRSLDKISDSHDRDRQMFIDLLQGRIPTTMRPGG